MQPDGTSRIDSLAIWHNKRSTFSYSDGIAEKHKWINEHFIEWNLRAMHNTGFTFNLTPPANEREDIEYMAKGFPYKSLN